MTYLTWWRMTTAGQLLRNTDLPLPKIARRAGYSSAFAFSHAFKRHFGVPPRQYRSPDGGFAQIGPGMTGRSCLRAPLADYGQVAVPLRAVLGRDRAIPHR